MNAPAKTYVILLLLLASWSAEAQWLRSAKSRAFSRSNGVATDGSGNVYTAGVFSCIAAFGADSLLNNSCGEVSPPAPALPQTDGFLSRHDEDGNLTWVIQFTGSPGNKLFVNDIATDPSGVSYVTGAYTGSLDLIAAQFNNPDPTTEFFLAKIQPDGTVAWAVSYPVDEFSETFAQKVAVTVNGVYITGYVRDDFQIGVLADSVGNNASFVASFDLAGNVLWEDHFMEINEDGTSLGKAIEAVGDSIWVFSSFTDTVNISGTNFRPPGTNPSINAGVICLYDAAGVRLNQILTNTPYIESMRMHRPDQSLYITGRAENITAIGPDTLFTTPGVRAYVSSHSLDMSALTLLQWAMPLTSATTAGLTGTDLDVSAQGSILATGTFRGATLNGATTSAGGGGGQSGFLLKLDATGADQWLQSFGGAGEDALSAVSAPDDARIFGAGYFNQYLRIAGEELHISSASNGFVARIDVCPQLIADMITADSTFICERDTVQFQVTSDPAYTYKWFKDGTLLPTAAGPDMDVMEAGIYLAEITGAGCTKRTPPARLFLNPLPDSVVLTNDALEKCEGDVVNLAGPIGTYTFQWLDEGLPIAETDKDISIQTDGDYQVQVTDTLGCMILSDTFAIRFHPYPLPDLTPAAATHTLCSGNSLLLQADNSQSGLTWQWKKDDLPITDATTFDYAVTSSGIYHAVVRNGVGCETTTDADTVIVQASPVVDLNDESLPDEICAGNSVRLVTRMVTGQTYQWFRDNIAMTGEESNLLDVAQSGAYSVRVNNALCEKFSETFALTVHAIPSAVIVNNAQTSICEGEAFELVAQESANYRYEWLDGAAFLTGEEGPSLDITKTGNFRVRVTNEFNCSDTSPPTTIVVNLSPPAAVKAEGDVVFCEGGEVLLTANAGTALQYEWMKDGAFLGSPAQRTLLVTESGLFQVRVTNSNLCAAISPPVEVRAVAYPASVIASDNGENTVCDRDSVLLSAGAGNTSYNYVWLHNARPVAGATDSKFYAKAAGGYRVVTSEETCRDTSTVLTLQVRSNPVPLITRNEAFLSVALFGDIQWFRNGAPIAGANLQSMRILEDGDYTVNVVNAEGCSAWSEVVPMCLPIPDIVKTNDVLFVSIPAREYRWEYGQIPISGAALRRLSAQQSGNYSVVVVSDDGCVMETEPVTVCIPYPYITQDDFTGVLNAFPNPASSYQWYVDGDLISDGNTQVHIPEEPGSYTVRVTDLEGCASASEPFLIAPVTGVERFPARLHFFPNPAKDFLIVEKTQGQNVTLILFDALGRQVMDMELADDRAEIELTALPAGTYMLMARTGDAKASWKLVKN